MLCSEKRVPSPNLTLEPLILHSELLSHPRSMAKAPLNSVAVGKAALFRPRFLVPGRAYLFPSTIRASDSVDGRNNKVYKELGLFSLKKKIEDAVNRAEMVAPAALELEEARRYKQEEVLREYNLWDDLARSNESLTALADTIKVVNDLKDLRYKAEEAKLICELAEMDAINHQLFKEAYKASEDVSKFLDHYEMSKLLGGPYDKEGACVIIKSGPKGITSEVWAEKILNMYTKWAEKHGYKGRVIEKYPSNGGGIRAATIEFESEYVYGYLCGEKGTHRTISSLDGSIGCETCSAAVDVIPLFIERVIDLHIDDKDLEISSLSSHRAEQFGYGTDPVTSIHHIPSGTTIHCSGERSHFANKIKALDRLKAKLLVLAMEQGVAEVGSIKRDAITNIWEHETRRYMFSPYSSVEDVKTGIRVPDLNSVLDGNIEPLIRAHINFRHEREIDA